MIEFSYPDDPLIGKCRLENLIVIVIKCESAHSAVCIVSPSEINIIGDNASELPTTKVGGLLLGQVASRRLAAAASAFPDSLFRLMMPSETVLLHNTKR